MWSTPQTRLLSYEGVPLVEETGPAPAEDDLITLDQLSERVLQPPSYRNGAAHG